MAALYREVFAGIAKDPPDLEALAKEHARTALCGLAGPSVAPSSFHERGGIDDP